MHTAMRHKAGMTEALYLLPSLPSHVHKYECQTHSSLQLTQGGKGLKGSKMHAGEIACLQELQMGELVVVPLPACKPTEYGSGTVTAAIARVCNKPMRTSALCLMLVSEHTVRPLEGMHASAITTPNAAVT